MFRYATVPQWGKQVNHAIAVGVTHNFHYPKGREWQSSFQKNVHIWGNFPRHKRVTWEEKAGSQKIKELGWSNLWMTHNRCNKNVMKHFATTARPRYLYIKAIKYMWNKNINLLGHKCVLYKVFGI